MKGKDYDEGDYPAGIDEITNLTLSVYGAVVVVAFPNAWFRNTMPAHSSLVIGGIGSVQHLINLVVAL